MPTYLCHGFRWHRASIRVFVVVQNLDDATPDWVVRPGTAQSLITTFYELFEFLPIPPEATPKPPPEAIADNQSGGREKERRKDAAKGRKRSKSLSRRKEPRTPAAADADSAEPPQPPPGVVTTNDGRDEVLAAQDGSPIKILEEYDPQRLDEVSRPHAYVADYVARIDLSVSIGDAMAAYEMKLRQEQEQMKETQKESKKASISSSSSRRNIPAMTGPPDEGSALTALAGAPEKPSKKKSSGGNSGSGGGTGWLELLRDQLQRGEEIRWFIVVNGDEERDFRGRVLEEPERWRGRTHGPTTETREENKGAAYGRPQQSSNGYSQPRRPQAAAAAPQLPSISPQSDMGMFLPGGFEASKGGAAGPSADGDDEDDDDDEDYDTYDDRQEDLARERERERLRIELGGDRNILRDDDDEEDDDESNDNDHNAKSPANHNIHFYNGTTAKRQHYRSLEPRSPPTAAPLPATSLSRPTTPSGRQQYLLQQQQQLAPNAQQPPSRAPPVPPVPPLPQLPQQPPTPQQQQPPTLRPKMSIDSSLRPKTPSGRSGGFRRLFSRGKPEEVKELGQ